MSTNKVKLAVLIVIITINTISVTVFSESLQKIQTDDNYDLLIISPNKFIIFLKVLEKHKEKHSVETKIVDANNIYKNDEIKGRDNQEKIKYFIKNEYDTHSIKYVLLVGDYKQIPVRYINNVDLDSAWPELNFISDLYYADIYDEEGNFSSWNSNDNELFGEWSRDVADDADIDLKPDVYVGRLACSNILDVITVVQKIIIYETKTYDSEWFKRIVGVGGDSYIEHEGNEGEINTQNAMDNLPDFDHIKLWASNGNLTNQNDVINAINQGCGFIYFDGHGTPMWWVTFPPNNNSRYIYGLSTMRMTSLKNKEKLPICLVSSCHNLQIDVKPLNILSEPTFHHDWIIKCWGSRLLSKIGGGAIAAIGNTGFGLSKEDKISQEGADSYLYPQFFWEYGINGTSILGETWGKAINNYLEEFPIDWNTPHWSDSSKDAKTLQQWILLGDPSLKIGGYEN
jgi:hypothetical protein